MFGTDNDMIFAFEEEIGDTDLFSGRKKEIDDFIDWAMFVKKKVKPSIALLARRKKGKTALVQRLFNVLYNMNDPMIIPVYYKVKEYETSKIDIAKELYLTVLNHYAAFIHRTPQLINNQIQFDEIQQLFIQDSVIFDDISRMKKMISENDSSTAWNWAAYAAERISILKNIRIIQILDEFQYFNEYVYDIDDGIKFKTELCGTYHHVGASKIAPVIVTGSYISWLLRIISKMTGRYQRWLLKNLPFEEAIEAVYAYSKTFNIAVTEESAVYIAKVTQGDVFYISAMFNTTYSSKDLTNFDCIDQIILHETRTAEHEYGSISGMWLEYLYSAISKVNDQYAKKIILYLAKYQGEERTRDQINQDLNLNMKDFELETKLQALISADILRQGSNAFRYKGLGDRFFDIIFRRTYQEEIKSLSIEDTTAKIESELRSLRGEVSYHKGLITEYAVINRMLFAVMNGHKLSEIVAHHIPGYELNRFSSAHKHRITLNQSNYIEVDIFIKAYNSKDSDYVIEVKNWKTKITKKHIEKFIETKNTISPILKPDTGFIFYSHNPLSKSQEELLLKNQIMPMYTKTLIDNKSLDKHN